jgi:hypothetical protein
VDSGEVVSVDLTLTVDDARVLQTAIRGESAAMYSSLYWSLRGAVAIGLVAVAFVHPLALFLAIVEVAVITLELRLWRRARGATNFTSLDGRYSLEIDGLHRISETSESIVRWPAVEVRQTGAHFLILFAQSGWIVPFRCFGSPEQRDRFRRVLQERSRETSARTGSLPG